MDFIKCNECKYRNECPCGWSYLNAACITIQKREEDNGKKENEIN